MKIIILGLQLVIDLFKAEVLLNWFVKEDIEKYGKPWADLIWLWIKFLCYWIR